MKKRVNKIFLIGLVIILSLSLVSASLFGDFLNKITGKVTGNETNETTPSPIIHIPVTPCTDTEEKADPYVKGTVTDASGSWTDYCLDGTQLVEYECRIGGVNGTYVSTLTISCSSINYICSEGKCVTNPNYQPPASTTSSGGGGGGGSSGGGSGTSPATSLNISGGGSSGGGSGTSPATSLNISGGNNIPITRNSSGERGVVSQTTFNVNSRESKIIGSSGIVAVSSVQISTSEGKAYATKEDGNKQEIKIDPTTAINSVKESIKSEAIGEVRMVEYKDKVVYEIDATKPVKVIILIPANMAIKAKVDIEEGNIISIEKPWWKFLAKEI